MMKTKTIHLNQFDHLRERFKQKREAKKPFEARGSIAQSDKPKKEPKKKKAMGMYDENGFLNPDYKGRWI